MRSILVQLDETTYDALERIAPASERRRSRFIRDAIQRAVRIVEYRSMRAAYEAKPDNELDADAWEMPEEWQA